MKGMLAFVVGTAVPACIADESPGPSTPTLATIGDLPGLERIVATPDGALVGAGRAGDSGASLSVVRFSVGGAVDPSYGDGGRVLLDGDLASASLAALLGVGDGSVLIATRDTNGGGALVRVTADGHLDPGFGDGGVLALDRAPGALALRPGGGYLIGVDSSDGYDVALATDDTGSGTSRVNDALFGFDGDSFAARTIVAAGDQVGVGGVLRQALAVIWYGNSYMVEPADPYLDPRGVVTVDNGFVIGGLFQDGTGFGAVHFTTSGAFDETYGTNGVARTGVASTTAATVADPWGGTLLVGTSDEAPHPRILRLRADGTLDPAFGLDGVLTDLATDATIADAALVADGVVAVGTTADGYGIVAHYVW